MWKFIPNALSLSRIPLALGVILTYKPYNRTSFFVALIIISIALATDFIDGALARRWGHSGDIGYIVDGLADRSFYIALILAMVAAHSLPLTIAWLLIMRELLMYAVRLLQPGGWFQNNSEIRLLSLWQAGAIRVWFLTFFLADALALLTQARPYDSIAYQSIQHLLLLLTLCSGYLSIVHLVRKAISRRDVTGRD